jgi:lipopolysaccharide transport system permease protein
VVSDEIVIQPDESSSHYWDDLWRYRELFVVLAWRDIAVRYKQTIIGVLWALIRPLLAMVIFTVVFGKIAQLPSEGQAPYALMVFAGLLPWTFFSTSFADAANSLVSNSNLVSKVYFPRMLVPAASLAVGCVDFLISFAILVMMLLWYGFTPGWHIVALPLFLVLGIGVTMGPSLLVTSLNVRYRDFRYVIPFLLQLGMYASPVGFSSSVVPEKWRLLYSLNPLVGVIDGFRWSLLGGQIPIYVPATFISAFIAALFLLIGVKQFRKMEAQFADLI